MDFEIIEEYKIINPIDIRIKYENPRKILDDEEMEELVNSVQESGVLNPIWVSLENNQLYLIAGERRLKACKKVGLNNIPVKTFSIKDEKTVRILQTMENEQRKDLSQEEKFDQYKKMEELGMSISDISKMTGINSTTIRGILDLKYLKKEILQRKDIGDFAKTQLARLREDEQLVIARKLVTKDSRNNRLMTGRKLYRDVVKNLERLEKDESLDQTEKEKIRSTVIKEATKDVLASRIISREKEKIMMRQEGKMPKIIDNSIVQRYIDESDKYYRLLLEMIECKVEIADQFLVSELVLSIMGVQDALNQITGRFKK